MVEVRAPHLHSALRGFCLGAFAFYGREVEQGAEITFVFEEHGSRDRPTLYEYRPLVRSFVEARGGRLLGRGDTAIALEALGREPAAAIFARAHAHAQSEHALFRTVLLPLVADVAEACGGFDWDDDAFDRAYAELEESMFGDERVYAAVAPLVGVEVGQTIPLGDGLRVRHAADGELVAHWPDAARLGPESFGREPDRMCVLELEQPMPADGGEPPDAPGEIADAVTALRLATCGPIAAGPVLFERLDWRPFGVRPVLPIAATQPPGEPTRLDVFRGETARVLIGKLGAAEDDRELGDALDRWELALFQDGSFRAEQLRSSLEALLGNGDGAWAAALRTAVLLGETGRERQDCLFVLRRLCEGVARPEAADLVRRALVVTVTRGDREKLIGELDESLLGVRPTPSSRVDTGARQLIRTRHICRAVPRLPWTRWRRSGRSWSGSRGSTACAGRTRRPTFSSTRCARCWPTPRTGSARSRCRPAPLTRSSRPEWRWPPARACSSCRAAENPVETGRILFGAEVLLHNGCVQDCTKTGRSGDT